MRNYHKVMGIITKLRNLSLNYEIYHGRFFLMFEAVLQEHPSLLDPSPEWMVMMTMVLHPSHYHPNYLGVILPILRYLTRCSWHPVHGISYLRIPLQALSLLTPSSSPGHPHLVPLQPLRAHVILVLTWHTIHSMAPFDEISNCYMGSLSVF